MPVRSFHQILQEKIASSPQNSEPRTSIMDASIQTLKAPLHTTADTTFIDLYNLRSFEGTIKKGAKQYQKVSFSTAQAQTQKRKPHSFSPTQSQAYFIFNTWEKLSPAFTPRELKAAFRRLVKRLHPDQGGTIEDFRNLHSSYRELSLIFQDVAAI